MKRLSMLSILILFVTISCAGTNQTGWTKRNFHQGEFEKDWKECIQALNKNSYSQTSGLLADCLARKGYEYTGPIEITWTKSDFSQDEFEKDRKDCVQSVQESFQQKLTFEECLVKKGYKSEPPPSSEKEKSKSAEVAKKAEKKGGTFLVVVSYAAIVVGAIILLML